MDRHLAHPDLDDDARGRDHHDLAVIRHRLDAGHHTGPFRDLVALHAAAASGLNFELGERRALSDAVFRDNQEGIALGIQLCAHNLIALIQTDAAHAGRIPAGAPHIALAEADRHALLRDKEDLVSLHGLLDLDELIVIPQVDRIESVLADVFKGAV